PALNQALAEIEVEGVRLDLHRKLRLVGLTFGIEPTTATLGWAAVEELVVIRHGQAVPINGLALHFTALTRFEASFHEDPPGQLEYFELRHDPEMTLLFFFEGGTLRLSSEECRAELVIESDDEPVSESGPEPGAGPDLVQ
ncbi:MAG: hypothetical protein ACRD1L_13935, partial [Terriglobales bacterium]